MLNHIADTKAELINPEDFADLSDKAYEVLLDDFEAYLFEEDVYHLNRYRELKEKLEVLVERFSDRIRNLIPAFAPVLQQGRLYDSSE